MKSVYIPLTKRQLLAITGDDTKDFLQGIITNDINNLSSKNSIYACLLTPQGKYLADFFISEIDNQVVLDFDDSVADTVTKKLAMYKLRSDVTFKDMSKEFEVCSLLGDNIYKQEEMDASAGSTMKFCKGVACIDPRTKKMFGRSVIERENEYQSFVAKGFELGEFGDYERLRIENTVPETNKELIPEKSFPLQNRLDELNAIDFDKGCYVGQEVTARSKHRGNIRKTLKTVDVDEENKDKVTSEFDGRGILLAEK